MARRADEDVLTLLYHLVSRRDFEAARASGSYRPPAFAREGFVHCSYVRQLAAVANRIFAGRDDLVVLEIDPAQLDCRLVDENLEGGSELYPHVYGEIPLAAIRRVLEFPCAANGFDLPDALQSGRPRSAGG
jgi:uncharacterized protein (DUF952 family)